MEQGRTPAWPWENVEISSKAASFSRTPCLQPSTWTVACMLSQNFENDAVWSIRATEARRIAQISKIEGCRQIYECHAERTVLSFSEAVSVKTRVERDARESRLLSLSGPDLRWRNFLFRNLCLPTRSRANCMLWTRCLKRAAREGILCGPPVLSENFQIFNTYVIYFIHQYLKALGQRVKKSLLSGRGDS